MKQPQNQQQYTHEQLQDAVEQVGLDDYDQAEAQPAHSRQDTQIVGTGAGVGMTHGDHNQVNECRQQEHCANDARAPQHDSGHVVENDENDACKQQNHIREEVNAELFHYFRELKR